MRRLILAGLALLVITGQAAVEDGAGDRSALPYASFMCAETGLNHLIQGYGQASRI